MKPNLPNIFDYNDFRKYLADYQNMRYAFDKDFTKSYICKKLGIEKTRSYFGDIIAGKFVSSTYAARFIKLFELDKDEAQFFRVLVNFNQSENDPEERELYFNQLISLNKTPLKIIDKKIFQYYKEWYHSIIRAILNIYDFDGNYKILAKKVFPPLKTKQAKESVKLLIDLELISKNEHGFYKPTDKAISSGTYARNELIMQYQLKCLELAKNALLKNKKNNQVISTKMISVSELGYRRILEHLKKFDSEIRSIVHKDENPADRVYQLDILFFPNSK